MTAWTEVNADEYVTWAEDAHTGMAYPEHEFPVDEWMCRDCGEAIGFIFYDDSDRPGITWHPVFVLAGTDPRQEDAARLCEGCIPEVTA